MNGQARDEFPQGLTALPAGEPVFVQDERDGGKLNPAQPVQSHIRNLQPQVESRAVFRVQGLDAAGGAVRSGSQPGGAAGVARFARIAADL